tara:strand:- start:114 stop:242 length:129 start_codon:yes stop_codon:yes gene_type:complete
MEQQVQFVEQDIFLEVVVVEVEELHQPAQQVLADQVVAEQEL